MVNRIYIHDSAERWKIQRDQFISRRNSCRRADEEFAHHLLTFHEMYCQEPVCIENKSPSSATLPAEPALRLMPMVSTSPVMPDEDTIFKVIKKEIIEEPEPSDGLGYQTYTVKEAVLEEDWTEQSTGHQEARSIDQPETRVSKEGEFADGWTEDSDGGQVIQTVPKSTEQPEMNSEKEQEMADGWTEDSGTTSKKQSEDAVQRRYLSVPVKDEFVDNASEESGTTDDFERTRLLVGEFIQGVHHPDSLQEDRRRSGDDDDAKVMDTEHSEEGDYEMYYVTEEHLDSDYNEDDGIDMQLSLQENVLDSLNKSVSKKFGANFGKRRKLRAGAKKRTGRKYKTAALSTHNSAAEHQKNIAPGLLQAFKGYSTVADILKSDARDGAFILQKLEMGEIDQSTRRKIVKIVTKYLTDISGDLYPRGQEKEAMARALVMEFPCLKDRTPGCEGHELYYKDGAGFIEYRLKTIRSTSKRSVSSRQLDVMNVGVKRKKPWNHMIAEVSQQNYKVADILKSDVKDGATLLQKLEKHEVNQSSRQRIVQIVTRYLTDKAGDLYPRSQEKEAMARALVMEFPCLKDRTPGCEGHELFYKDGAGFIEYRLKTIRSSSRRSFPSGHLEATNSGVKGKRMKPNDKDHHDIMTPSTEVLEQMEWLKHHPPSSENNTQIRTYMRSTFEYRRSILLNEAPSISKVLTDVPRFRDMPELINLDFDMLHPGCGLKMLVKWNLFFKPRLLQLTEEPEKYTDLDVFSFLLEKLPNVSSRGLKSKGKQAFSFFAQCQPIGTDVETFARDSSYTQPYILALGEEGYPEEFFIIVDTTSIPGGKTVVEAFDRLFKLHLIFKIEFAKPLATFFNFFEGIVYQIIPQSIRPTVRELYSEMVRAEEEGKVD